MAQVDDFCFEPEGRAADEGQHVEGGAIDDAYIRLQPGPAGHVELLDVDLVEAGSAKPITDVLDGAPFRVGPRPPWTDHVAQLPRVPGDVSARPGLAES